MEKWDMVPPFSTSALDTGKWSTSCHNLQGKNPSTHWTGDWVGLRAGLDNVEKRIILLLSGIEPHLPSP
jgi:hypothetical protein